MLLTSGYYRRPRRTGLVNLRWPAADLERRILHVVKVPKAGELTKSRKNRSLPMHPAVETALAGLWATAAKRVEDGRIVAVHPHVFTWPDCQPFKTDWLTHESERLVKRAGIASCSLHDLRRSFSTILQRIGIDGALVKDLGGWSCLAVVDWIVQACQVSG